MTELPLLWADNMWLRLCNQSATSTYTYTKLRLPEASAYLQLGTRVIKHGLGSRFSQN